MRGRTDGGDAPWRLGIPEEDKMVVVVVVVVVWKKGFGEGGRSSGHGR